MRSFGYEEFDDFRVFIGVQKYLQVWKRPVFTRILHCYTSLMDFGESMSSYS